MSILTGREYSIKNIFLILLLAALISEISCIDNYKAFKPVYVINESYTYSNEKVTEPFYSNIIFVLKYYKEKYKINKNGIIYVHRSLYYDKELLFNYTKKAKDPVWLKEHK